MRYLTFNGDQESYDIAFLVPQLNESEIRKHYIDPYGLDPNNVICFDLEYTKKKMAASDIKSYLKEHLPVLRDLNVKYIIICDGDYFKVLTKTSKAEAALGYVLEPKAVEAVHLGYTPNVMYCPNFKAIFYDPEKVTAKIKQSMTALVMHIFDSYQDPGHDIIKFAAYPKTYAEIHAWLRKLIEMDCDLTCDIEAFSLRHYDAGIGTIAFAWNKNEGVAFPIDYAEETDPDKIKDKLHGYQKPDPELKILLREFFKAFKRKIIFHNISYDGMVLIYELFMKDILDTEGLLDGLDVILKNFEDTKIITYLATNSCAGNKLSLKDQAQEFAGNYAQDEIKDIRRIPLQQLLTYNLIDCFSTWHVHEKHYQTMINDQQLQIYEELFKPALIDIIQMQLTGMPVDMSEVVRAKARMQSDLDNAVSDMKNLIIVQNFIFQMNVEWVNWKNSILKKKQVTLADAKEEFNPNSDPQIRTFLYDIHKLPVLDKTDSGLGATGQDTLEKLVHHTNDPEMKIFLNAMVAYKKVAIILSNFIPALEGAKQGPDGWHYLFGNFNLGGTKSGRLSSNNPNLQNIPATGSDYAKVIKKCFKAPKGWLFVGLDFDSLEDRISALTTKDPNKLKVYTDGYDGHCLRAYSYFGDQMPDIDPNSVESINSIAKKYKPLRQDSKVPTFLLTYGGTYKGIMDQVGWDEAKAKDVESKYHVLYAHSDHWVQVKVQQAAKDGYVIVAFGLRLRTPLLKQTILNTRKTPFEAQAEARTAGNALGQSWGLLNTRAGVEFLRKVRTSKYRLDIRPCAHIHDAQYFMTKDDMGAVLFLNEHLVKAARWQNHPDIYHPQVKLGGSVGIFYPNWAYEMAVPNEITEEQLKTNIKEYIEELKEDGVL